MAKKETEQQKTNRAKKCFEHIKKVLESYNCEIEPHGSITVKGIQLGININPK